MIKCSKCGDRLRFDIDSQMLVCGSCGAKYAPDNVGDENFSEERRERSATIYVCSDCGARVEADESVAATFCSFCGASVTMKSRQARVRTPERIVPFRVNKKTARDKYVKAVSHWFVPSDMRRDGTVDRMTGIYMPYSQSEEGLVDTSSSFDDAIGCSIEPFDTKGSVPYKTAYTAGFYADTEDDKRKKTGERSIYLPTWFLAYRGRDNKVSYAVLNGQNGKMFADIPVSPVKFVFAGLVLALVGFLCLLQASFTMTVSSVVTIAAAMNLLSLLLTYGFAKTHIFRVAPLATEEEITPKLSRGFRICFDVVLGFMILELVAISGIDRGNPPALWLLVLDMLVFRMILSKRKFLRKVHERAAYGEWFSIVSGFLLYAATMLEKGNNEGYEYVLPVTGMALAFFLLSMLSIIRENNSRAKRLPPQLATHRGGD